jgi:nucleoid-associated protein YgaU
MATKKPTPKKKAGGIKRRPVTRKPVARKPVARKPVARKPVRKVAPRKTSVSAANAARLKAIQAVYAKPKPIAMHTVTDGETLSHIALRYYGNAGPAYYTHIYNANKAVIGDDMNMVRTGMQLEIPPKPENI